MSPLSKPFLYCQAKPGKKKTYEDKDTALSIQDETLDDPIAEKLRRQRFDTFHGSTCFTKHMHSFKTAQNLHCCRLVEEADLQHAKELFGSARGTSATGLDSFEPKSLKDHEELARMVAQQYLLPHSKNQHYKTLLKTLLKQTCQPVALQEVKDLETCIAGIKSDKLKEEKAAKDAKKGTDNNWQGCSGLIGSGVAAWLSKHLKQLVGWHDPHLLPTFVHVQSHDSKNSLTWTFSRHIGSFSYVLCDHVSNSCLMCSCWQEEKCQRRFQRWLSWP